MPQYLNKITGDQIVFASAPSAGYNIDIGGDEYFLAQSGSVWYDVLSGTLIEPSPEFASAPVNTVAPVASGTGAVGQTLSVTDGTWTDADSFTYQWQSDSVDIVGATSSTFVVTASEAGTDVRCVVTATNGAGSTEANSNAIAIDAMVLDSYPATTCISSILLSSTYSGNAIRIREDSGDTEADIPWDGASWDHSAIASHCGSADGFLVKVYDQSGNGNDWYAAGPTTQPKIYIGSTGSVISDGGIDAIDYFDGTTGLFTDLVNLGSNTDLYEIRSSSDTAATFMIQYPSTGIYSLIANQGGTSEILSSSFGTPSYYVNGLLQSWTTRGDAWSTVYDGSRKLLTTLGGDTSTWTNITLSLYPSAGFSWIGKQQCFIGYNSDTSANRVTIETMLSKVFGL